PQLLINGAATVVTSGEARKIAFARALLRKPSILVLDEAFSFMDDDDIGRAIDLIPEKVITLIISRNPVVMKRAYRVFELRNGILQDYGADS
ncbi:MAG: hypothetical protein R2727_06515, partial [Bacteroidales bacterium]